jgi:hypothetical protein
MEQALVELEDAAGLGSPAPKPKRAPRKKAPARAKRKTAANSKKSTKP